MLLGWGFIISTAKESSQESALLHLFQNHIFAAVMPNTKIKTKKKEKTFQSQVEEYLGRKRKSNRSPKSLKVGLQFG